MIVIDFSQVMLSNLMVTLGNHMDNTTIEEDLLRHFILNSLRSYNSKHRNDFGEMIIACDDGFSWRKDVFPYYKANRKKSRDSSKLDWNMIFTCLNKIREEVKTFFPYRVIHVKRAEADDVIGTLCHKFGNTSEKILIVSGDKDFRQLQTYFNVQQLDPIKRGKNKQFIVENDPERYLKEHIIRGDGGDGVPNFLSDDDSLVMGKRQKPVSNKKLDIWVHQKPEDFCDEKMLRGFKRNEMMVDLWKIPSGLQEEIITEYEAQAGKGRSQLMNYFIKNRLKNLMECINDF